MKLFHVDRSNQLIQGQKIELFNDYRIEGSDGDAIYSHIKSFFPEGITEHGFRYLLKGGDNATLEAMLEVVRRQKYSDSLSRFQSFFAVDETTLPLCIENLKPKLPFRIVEVKAERYEHYDMSILKGDSYGISLFYAEKYWAGQTSNHPIIEYLLKPPVEVTAIIQTEKTLLGDKD